MPLSKKDMLKILEATEFPKNKRTHEQFTAWSNIF